MAVGDDTQTEEIAPGVYKTTPIQSRAYFSNLGMDIATPATTISAPLAGITPPVTTNFYTTGYYPPPPVTAGNVYTGLPVSGDSTKAVSGSILGTQSNPFTEGPGTDTSFFGLKQPIPYESNSYYTPNALGYSDTVSQQLARLGISSLPGYMNFSGKNSDQTDIARQIYETMNMTPEQIYSAYSRQGSGKTGSAARQAIGIGWNGKTPLTDQQLQSFRTNYMSRASNENQGGFGLSEALGLGLIAAPIIGAASIPALVGGGVGSTLSGAGGLAGATAAGAGETAALGTAALSAGLPASVGTAAAMGTLPEMIAAWGTLGPALGAGAGGLGGVLSSIGDYLGTTPSAGLTNAINTIGGILGGSGVLGGAQVADVTGGGGGVTAGPAGQRQLPTPKSLPGGGGVTSPTSTAPGGDIYKERMLTQDKDTMAKDLMGLNRTNFVKSLF